MTTFDAQREHLEISLLPHCSRNKSEGIKPKPRTLFSIIQQESWKTHNILPKNTKLCGKTQHSTPTPRTLFPPCHASCVEKRQRSTPNATNFIHSLPRKLWKHSIPSPTPRTLHKKTCEQQQQCAQSSTSYIQRSTLKKSGNTANTAKSYLGGIKFERRKGER